jgi:hypothetical protein
MDNHNLWDTVGARMAPYTRADLVAEITELQRQQLESFADGTFGGWPPEREAAHQKRGVCLARLVLDLEALDGTSPGR